MSELEDRLRRGHPEERQHRPVPFEEVAARPRPVASRGANRRLRLATLLAAAFAVFAVAILGQPLGLRDAPAVDAPRDGAAAAGSPAESRPLDEGSQAPAPAPEAAPIVDCGSAEAPECDQVVAAVRAAAGEELARIELDSFAPAGVGSQCAPPASGWCVTTSTRLSKGESIGWVCDAASPSSVCRAAAPILSLTVEGATDQAVLLFDAAGTRTTIVADPTVERTLPVGRWILTVPGAGCDAACLARTEAWDASAPPGGCSAQLDAVAGRQYDVMLMIRGRAPCQIEVR